jgi:26S proteasome regulatory subunit N2
LRLLLRLFDLSADKDYSSVSQIWLQIADVSTGASLAADTIKSLIERGDKLQVYQVGFDLAEGGGQDFLKKVSEALGSADDVSGRVAVNTTCWLPISSVSFYLQETSKNLKDILSGEKSIRLYLEFLQKNNHADLRILKNTKVKEESESDECVQALT